MRESPTWAYVDGLAGNVAGEIAAADRQARGAHRRVGRGRGLLGAQVRTVVAAARHPAGTPDLASFTWYAEPMLAEKEFFIRKAIGWVLRETSRRDPAWVAKWTEGHISEISGVALREAIRRLPADEAERLSRLR